MAVYEAYYHCRREPFSLSPDPSFLYASASHREALAQLRYVVQERKGFAVVTGEVGTGKTLLLRSLLQRTGPKVQSAYIFNPPPTCHALYDAIGEDLGLKLDFTATPATQLNRHLLKASAEGGTVVFIFDEAHSLSFEVLEEIRLLTNIETSSAKLLQVILAGQPELDAMLETRELRALRQRLVFRCSLAPLSQPDTLRYIASRLREAGAQQSPFTLAACNLVYRYSEGLPRLINVICDNAMLLGYAKGSPEIEEADIQEVAADLKLAKAFAHEPHLNTLARDNSVVPKPTRATWRRRMAVGAFVAVAGVAVITVILALITDHFLLLTPLMDQVGRLFSHSIYWLAGHAETRAPAVCGSEAALLSTAEGYLL